MERPFPHSTRVSDLISVYDHNLLCYSKQISVFFDYFERCFSRKSTFAKYVVFVEYSFLSRRRQQYQEVVAKNRYEL